MKHKKFILVLSVLCFFSVVASLPGALFAVENPDITTGLNQVDASALAEKILKIGLGAGALAGTVAAVMLIYLGFKLKIGNERSRSDTKEHIMYVFIGLALVGLAVVIVGFFAFLIKGA